MKVQCDVCSKGEASVFCCADEAALCIACDRKVHRANKLAGKHRRFSLSSSVQTHPLCDICQEKRGFVFCQQDRAILCHDCDGPIHSANDLTMKHSRFLLTGVRLSAELIAESGESEIIVANGSSNEKSTVSNINTSSAAASAVSADSSSISEYLTKTLPGYCVEDLLNQDTFYKSNELLPFVGSELDWDASFGVGMEELPIRVPVPNDFGNGIVGSVSGYSGLGVKMGRERWNDESFIVPQLNNNKYCSSNTKRQRSSASPWDF